MVPAGDTVGQELVTGAGLSVALPSLRKKRGFVLGKGFGVCSMWLKFN